MEINQIVLALHRLIFIEISGDKSGAIVSECNNMSWLSMFPRHTNNLTTLIQRQTLRSVCQTAYTQIFYGMLCLTVYHLRMSDCYHE